VVVTHPPASKPSTRSLELNHSRPLESSIFQNSSVSWVVQKKDGICGQAPPTEALSLMLQLKLGIHSQPVNVAGGGTTRMTGLRIKILLLLLLVDYLLRSSLLWLSQHLSAFMAKDPRNRLRMMGRGRAQGPERRFESDSVESFDSYTSHTSTSTFSPDERPRTQRGRASAFTRGEDDGLGRRPKIQRRHSTKEQYAHREYIKLSSWDIARLDAELDSLHAYCNALESSPDAASIPILVDIVERNIRAVSRANSLLVRDKKAIEREEKIIRYRGLSDQLYRLQILVIVEREYPCNVCGEKKKSSRFPKLITRRCTHPIKICKFCTRNWTTAQLESSGWNRIRCPECPELIEKDEMRDLSTTETYDR
jgi:hypothetical protein